jgi:4-amino-4-deoxy-L-arabinose transferase-like glycosyltransferase
LRPILPIDETRYVTVAWEMWLRRDFLVPHLNGLPYSDKPPLLFWLFHLGWAVFGVNEWWPRLVPPLCALVNLHLTAALARRLWPDRPWLARRVPLVLLGCAFWSVFTTMIMFDMLLAGCVLVALHGLLTARERPARGWLLVGVALGLGILAKGPVALLLPLIMALSAPFWGGERGRPLGPGGVRWWLGLLAAITIAAVLALAWALPAAAAGGTAYSQAIFLSQTQGRIVHAAAHGRPWWWYLPLLPVMLFPYSLWAPAWKSALRLRGEGPEPGLRFCLAWIVPGLVLFSLISGKQPHYLLPMLPAFALLIARALDGPIPDARLWHLAPPLAVLALFGVALAVVPLAGGRGLPTWAPLVSPGVGVALLALILLFAFRFHRFFAERRTAIGLLSLALFAALHFGLSEVSRRAYDLGAAARYVSGLERQGRPIAFVGKYHGQLHFLGRLRRPFAEIETGSEPLWLLRHPEGKVVQEFDGFRPELLHTDFVQPYRGGFLTVWGRKSRP